jgi:hypothetical protein
VGARAVARAQRQRASLGAHGSNGGRDAKADCGPVRGLSQSLLIRGFSASSVASQSLLICGFPASLRTALGCGAQSSGQVSKPQGSPEGSPEEGQREKGVQNGV